MTVRHRLRAVVTAVALVAGVSAVAWAHARLVQATPAANSRLPVPPAELRLVFSEAVTPRTSRIELVAPDSQRFQLALRGDSANATLLVADVPRLSHEGSYQVEWRLVGPDGHAVTGRYAFTVDSVPVVDTTSVKRVADDATMPATHDPSTDTMLQRAIRFGSVLAMVLIIGAVTFAMVVLPRFARGAGEVAAGLRSGPEQRLRRVAAVGAGLLLAVATVRLASHAAVLSGSLGAVRAADLGDLLAGSTFGRGWLLQVLAAVGLLAILQLRIPGWKVPAVFAALVAISAPFLGHPAAVADFRAVAMGLDALHVAAAGAWGGSIVMLAFVALPSVASAPTEARGGLVRHLLQSFTPVALVSATILALTGVAGGWLYLMDLDLLLTSEYGQMLVRKSVIVLVVAALGAYHWRIAQPAMATSGAIGRLRTTLAIDVVAVLLVLIVTALLTGIAPPVR